MGKKSLWSYSNSRKQVSVVGLEGYATLTRIFGLLWLLECFSCLSFPRSERESVIERSQVNSWWSATKFAGICLLWESFPRQCEVGDPAGRSLAQRSPDQSSFPSSGSSAAGSVGGCRAVREWSRAPLAPALCDDISVSLNGQQQLINFTRSWGYFLLSECPFWNFKSKAAKLVTGPLLSKLFWFSFEGFPNCTQAKKARPWGTQGVGAPL